MEAVLAEAALAQLEAFEEHVRLEPVAEEVDLVVREAEDGGRGVKLRGSSRA